MNPNVREYLVEHQNLVDNQYQTMALEAYKMINKLAPVCLHDLVHMKKL
jgi:hypothetical protein